MNVDIRKTIVVSILSALSIILVYTIRIPFFASFLEYEPADIPILMVTFLYGLPYALIMSVAVCIIQGITVSASSGIIGILMHILAVVSLVLVSGYLNKKLVSKYSVVISLICGSIVSIFSMVIWNVLFTPFFYGIPLDAVLKMIVPIIIPFNLLKIFINCGLFFVIYKLLNNSMFKDKK